MWGNNNLFSPFLINMQTTKAVWKLGNRVDLFAIKDYKKIPYCTKSRNVSHLETFNRQENSVLAT